MDGSVTDASSPRGPDRSSLARECPRERLHALGPDALSDAELVALVLRTGTARCDALESARRLLGSCGDLSGLARATHGELQSAPGLGPAKASALLAAVELGRRLSGRRLRPGDAIRSPFDVHEHFFERLRVLSQETFAALLLDGRHRVAGEVTISLGTLTASLVHPREVFRPAIRAAAAAVVLVHNHPSGDPTPSVEDRAVTRRLANAGELLGVRVLDHVIVAETGYFSFSEANELHTGESPP